MRDNINEISMLMRRSLNLDPSIKRFGDKLPAFIIFQSTIVSLVINF